jgi:hypothetical protein
MIKVTVEETNAEGKVFCTVTQMIEEPGFTMEQLVHLLAQKKKGRPVKENSQ